MSEQVKEVILKLVGMKGLADLISISQLLPPDSSYPDVVGLTAHLLQSAIDDVKQEIKSKLRYGQ